METKQITQDMRAALIKPLPPEAVSPHPTKDYLSTIKAIYVTERLNEVFGTGAWRVRTEFIEKVGKMIVVKVYFSIPDYGVEYECYGGNDNVDVGDAYKGATTDAITKIASWLGIGGEVFRGEVTASNRKNAHKPSPITTPKRKTITLDKLMEAGFVDRLCSWLQTKAAEGGRSIKEVFDDYYVADNEDTWDKIAALCKLY